MFIIWQSFTFYSQNNRACSQISDALLLFETKATHRQLGSKSRPNLGLFHSCNNYGRGGQMCESILFSERELKFMFAICQRRSVCLSSVVCLSSETFVHPTQAIEIFGNISTPCGTLAIHDLCIKILRRSSQGNPSVWGVKHKRGSRI